MALGAGGGGASSGAVRAGAAFVELSLKNFLPKGLNDAQKQWMNFGASFASIGRKMAVAGAASFTPLIGAFGTLGDLSKQGGVASGLGLTAEQFTGIAGIAKSVGEDTREFTESLVTLGKLGSDAAAGTEQAAAAFATLGLNAKDFIKLRADEQFFKMFEAINNVQDPLQRVRSLMMAFGEDGGKFLIPLLGKTNDELRAMAKSFAVSTADMKAATEAQKSYAAATTALSKSWQAVGIATAPAVKAIADGMTAAVAPFKDFVNTNREAVVGLGVAAAGLTGLGLGMMILGPAIKALTASWGIFTGAVVVGKAAIGAAGAMLSAPILILPAALAGAGAAWLTFTSQGRSNVKGFADAIAGAFGPTFANLTSGWKSVVATVGQGDLAAAFKIGTASLEIEWIRLGNFMTTEWENTIGELTKKWMQFTALVKGGAKAAGGDGAPGAEKKGMRGNPLLAAGLVFGGMNRAVFGDAKVDKQIEQQEKLANEIKLLGQELNKIGPGDVNAGARAEREKALQDAENRLKALQLGGYLKNQWGGLTGALSGGWGDMTKLFAGGNVGKQIEGIAQASRGTFGSNANAGFFGQGGNPVEKAVEKGNKLAERANELLAMVVAKSGQEAVLFVRGS